MSAETTYLRGLAQLLRREGPGTPVLVVDLDRLERNIERLTHRLPKNKSLRLVQKSLPCPELLAFIEERTGTRERMLFHAPFLEEAIVDESQDVLLGKPMPVRAAELFLASNAYAHAKARTEARRERGEDAATPAERVHWLIDTHARAAQYEALARKTREVLGVVLEIDVGLHRGGFREPRDLDPVVDILVAPDSALSFRGLMGYDAHVGKVPRALQNRESELKRVFERYRAFMARIQERAPGLLREGTTEVDAERVSAPPRELGASDLGRAPRRAKRPLIWNGGGSPTFAWHGDESPVNELAIGSALLKPARFDLPALEAFEPALFLATPVLKALEDTTLPGLEWGTRVLATLRPSYRRSYFVYGGRFDATWVHPEGTDENGLFGGSYNQTMINAPIEAGLEVDDVVLLRPNDSEFVMLGYGDVWAVRDQRVVAQWPVARG